MAVAELIEECCFNDTRDGCKGNRCPCGCHQEQSILMSYQQLQAEVERLTTALRLIQRNLLPCYQVGKRDPCPHLVDALTIVNKALKED